MRAAATAAQASGVPVVRHFSDPEDLCEALLPWIRPGDGVLVKGSRGMAMDRIGEALASRFGAQPRE